MYRIIERYFTSIPLRPSSDLLGAHLFAARIVSQVP